MWIPPAHTVAIAPLPSISCVSCCACNRMLQAVRVSRVSACRGLLPAWRAAGAQGYATEQASGPGLPGQGTMSEEQANSTSDRLYQGEGWRAS